MMENKKIKIASLFWSMQVWVSWGAWKVHATIWTMLKQDVFDMVYLQLEDSVPRYEHNWNIINLDEKFYLWFSLKKIISWFKLAWIIKNYCNTHNVDILLWQWDFFFMITGLSKLLWNKAICVWVVHTTLRVWPKIVQYLLWRSLKKNDKIVCISKQEQEFLTSNFWIKKNKLTLIHNSINLEHIKNNIETSLDEQESFLFIDNLFTYISVWRFTYQKNFRLLIDSFRLVFEKNKQTQLIIVWDGDEYNQLQDYVRTLWLDNNIKLLWKKNNPMQYMAHADCFVISSRFEWYPMVLLEACTCWLPLVSVDCPTWPAEVIWNNEWWILVEYVDNKNDINAKRLAEWMLQIIDTDRKGISQRNKNFVEQFDNKVIWKKWNEYLLTLN